MFQVNFVHESLLNKLQVYKKVYKNTPKNIDLTNTPVQAYQKNTHGPIDTSPSRAALQYVLPVYN